MRESCSIVSDVHRLLSPLCVPGTALSELDQIAEEYILSRGGRPAFKGYPGGGKSTPPFPSTLCVSINDEVVHGIPSTRRLAEGEIVSIDVGVEKDGYFGDGAMSHLVGPGSPEKERLLRVTRESLYRGLDHAHPGKRLHDVSAAVQQFVEENGFSVVRDLVGHGIGKNLHEDPPVPNYGKAGTGPQLQAGMTLAIEPMVNYGGYQVRVASNGWTVVTRDASDSAHFEHTVVITEDGPITLTDHFTREYGENGSHHS